jgi:RecJ-like exonuclease
VQWFDAEGEIKETIVGIIAGMSFGEGNVTRDTPVIAFADKEVELENGETELQRKVSSRGNRDLTRNGLDLSVVMQNAAEKVGGDGGGHDIAAGATIPRGERDAFIAHADEIIENQLD